MSAQKRPASAADGSLCRSTCALLHGHSVCAFSVRTVCGWARYVRHARTVRATHRCDKTLAVCTAVQRCRSAGPPATRFWWLLCPLIVLLAFILMHLRPL